MKYCWTTLLTLLLISACSSSKDDVVCYHVVEDDYTEQITVNGAIEAVNKTYLKSPASFLCTITWVEEDGALVQPGDTVCTALS